MPQITTKQEFISEVIEGLIAHGPIQTTTLVICSTKVDFLEQLQTSVEAWHPPRDEIPASQDETIDEDGATPPPPPTTITKPEAKHKFLTPTLHLIATSQRIKLAFCPSINTLRAYLSIYSGQPHLDAAGHSASQPTQAAHKLVVLNLLALHHSTSEFTVQGLSRTFAVVASAAYRTKSALQLIECKDARDLTDEHRGVALWNAEVPLLSGSVRIGGAGANWAGRTITVRRVVGRWFDFADEY